MYKFVRVCIITVGLLLGTTVTSQAQPSPAPRVWSIAADETTRTQRSISFRITFSEPVTGVDMSDFATSGDDQHARISRVTSSQQADSYTVDLMLQGPSTKLAVALLDDDSIVNAAKIPLGGIGAQNGNAISPAVTLSFIEQSPQTTAVHALQHSRTGPQPRSADRIIGRHSSIAVTTATTSVISYYDVSSKDLKLTICNDIACQNPTISTVDAITDVGSFSSLALTTANIPVISYFDETNQHLKLAICNDTRCTSPAISTIDSTAIAGSTSSLALTTSNIPVISYSDDVNKDLKLAVCTDTSCTSPSIMRIDSVGDVGTESSLALTSSNAPVISYFDETNDDLKIAFCNELACTSSTVASLASSGDVGRESSLALTTTNLPVVSYYDADNTDLMAVFCADVACTTTTFTRFYEYSDIGHNSSLALTTRNYPIITMLSTDGSFHALKLAVCGDTLCAGYMMYFAQSGVSVTGSPSLALTSDGEPVFSYFDATNNRLKLGRGGVFIDTAIDQGQPNSFAKSAPTTGQTVTATTTTLSWAASPYTSSYAYCLATTVAGCTAWTNAGTATTASISGLADGTTYYWQVRATNSSGTMLADSGTYGTFTVSLPPASFAKSSPANNATKQKTSLTLSWAASTYATSYEYCIALTTATCTTWKSTGTARTATITGLTKNKAYYWQVRAKNTAATTLSASTFWKFTTAP